MTLTSKQKRQEVSYSKPYHWFMTDNYSEVGRLYFGYIHFCTNLAKNSNGPILDAGCGDGRFLGELVQSGNNKNLHGVDYSERAVAFAKLLVPEADIRTAGLSSLPWPDNYFSDIYLIETLEHIAPAEIPPILSELKRALKPDGRLIITVPSKGMGEPKPDSKHYQHFSPESLKNTVEKYFSIASLYGQDKTGFHILKIFYRLVDNKFWDLKFFRRLYNQKIWPKLFNICKPQQGRRLIAICKKK